MSLLFTNATLRHDIFVYPLVLPHHKTRIMKVVTVLLALGIYVQVTGQNYTSVAARQDSLLIYQTYKDEIAFMESAANDKDALRWYARSGQDDSITNCAKLRLKKWNHETYKPAVARDREGYGTAYSYPEPGGPKRSAYSITDTQIKFMTRKDGKTETPYVQRTYFSGQGEVIKVERIDPLTVDWEVSRVLASDAGAK
jgi:hypothetical protein